MFFWYGKYKVNKGTYPSLDKVSNILKYSVIVLISSLYCAFMIGFLIDMFGYSDLLKLLQLQYFSINLFLAYYLVYLVLLYLLKLSCLSFIQEDLNIKIKKLD